MPTSFNSAGLATLYDKQDLKAVESSDLKEPFNQHLCLFTLPFVGMIEKWIPVLYEEFFSPYPLCIGPVYLSHIRLKMYNACATQCRQRCQKQNPILRFKNLSSRRWHHIHNCSQSCHANAHPPPFVWIVWLSWTQNSVCVLIQWLVIPSGRILQVAPDSALARRLDPSSSAGGRI